MVHLILFPLGEFFQPILCVYCIYFFIPSRILKLKAFSNTCHIFPPANFLSLSCVPIYFSTTSRILKLKMFHVPPYIFLLRIFFSHSCAPIYFSTTSWILQFEALHAVFRIRICFMRIRIQPKN